MLVNMLCVVLDAGVDAPKCSLLPTPRMLLLCFWERQPSPGSQTGKSAPAAAAQPYGLQVWSRPEGPRGWTEQAFCPRDQTGPFPGNGAATGLSKTLAATIDEQT